MLRVQFGQSLPLTIMDQIVGGFEHVQMVIERRSVREGRSQALRALVGCAGSGLVFSPMEIITMGENSLQPSGAWQVMQPSSHDALLASFILVPWRVWEPAPRNARSGWSRAAGQ